MLRKIIAAILIKQAQILLRRSGAKVVVVTGSIGKTSTTQAIGSLLEHEFVVRRTVKNYNTDIGVPCSMFQRDIPESLRNPIAWKWLFIRNTIDVIKQPRVDVFVLELGTDTPGEIAQFAWLKPDLAVITAVAPEHMEYFVSMDAVAKEELSVAAYSDTTLVNKHMIESAYLEYADTDELFGYSRDDLQQYGLQYGDLSVVGKHSIDAVVAAIKVAEQLGASKETIQAAKNIQPQPGRMRPFKGIKNSTIIDDTYNSSPEAALAALDYVYQTDAKQKIVLLGAMNELGDMSAQAHTDVGAYCDASKLDLVVTLGTDANDHLATAAEQNGCKVQRADNPLQAGQIIRDHLMDEAVVLYKGSQNGVFAEEAIKVLLVNLEDQSHLVRQSKMWMTKKSQQFADM